MREKHRSGRTGWLRAAVLGSDDAVVSISSLMIGEGNFSRVENQRAYAAIEAFLAKHGLTSAVLSNKD